MEDFFYAGGVPAVLREMGEAGALHRDALTVNGRSDMGERRRCALLESRRHSSVRGAIQGKGGIAVLRGNLAPDGAVIKLSAASPHLLQHRGPAVVFESIEEFHARIDDEGLDVDENCVMVLKNCGPRGYPGMAEVGNMPLPPKILRKGITDMVRISDARMSGTAYGTVVLHVCPRPRWAVRSLWCTPEIWLPWMYPSDISDSRSMTARSQHGAQSGRLRRCPNEDGSGFM